MAALQVNDVLEWTSVVLNIGYAYLLGRQLRVGWLLGFVASSIGVWLYADQTAWLMAALNAWLTADGAGEASVLPGDDPDLAVADYLQVIRYKTPTLAILSKVRKDSKDDEVKMMAMLIVAVSLDENGNQLFRPMNWADLFNSADPGVVQRIGDAVMSKVRFDAAAVEDAEKN